MCTDKVVGASSKREGGAVDDTILKSAAGGSTCGMSAKTDTTTAVGVTSTTTCWPCLEECAGAQPRLGRVLREVEEERPRHRDWLRQFEESCQEAGWSNCSCERWEAEKTSGAAEPELLGSSGYCQSHGVKCLHANVRYFLGVFVPAKEKRSSSPLELKETRRCAAAVKALLTHCGEKGYLDDALPADLLDELTVFGSFEEGTIKRGVKRLGGEDNFWRSEETASFCNSGRWAKRRRLSRSLHTEEPEQQSAREEQQPPRPITPE